MNECLIWRAKKLQEWLCETSAAGCWFSPDGKHIRTIIIISRTPSRFFHDNLSSFPRKVLNVNVYCMQPANLFTQRCEKSCSRSRRCLSVVIMHSRCLPSVTYANLKGLKLICNQHAADGNNLFGNGRVSKWWHGDIIVLRLEFWNFPGVFLKYCLLMIGTFRQFFKLGYLRINN